MDDLGLDDMMITVNDTADKAKRDKNASVQLMNKIRSGHESITKVVIKDDPVPKTAEDIFRALSKNKHIKTVNLKNCKISKKAMKYLVRALGKNKTLQTLIIYSRIPDSGMYELVKLLEEGNTTLSTLRVNNGDNKYWDSATEVAMKDRLESNKTLLSLYLTPVRSTDVRNALQKYPEYNKLAAQHSAEKKEGTAVQDAWDAYDDYDDDDSYEYVYDAEFSEDDLVDATYN